MTYSVPLKATLQLVVMEEVGETVKTKRPKNIIEKEVYLGELPILTPLGTFVINGAERVIVSQLHRSPGVVFEESTHPNGQRLFSARIIPFRGSWVEFTIDIHDVVYVHIDKKKKFPATALLRAFGYGTNAEILKLFYATKELDITGKLEGRAQKREVLGTLLAQDVPDPENKKGEPLGKIGDELTLEKFNTFRRAGISRVKVFAGYTALDLRDDAQPTTTREREQKYILPFHVAHPQTPQRIPPNRPHPSHHDARARAEVHPRLRCGGPGDRRSDRRERARAVRHAAQALAQGHGDQGGRAAAGGSQRVAPDQEHAGQGPDALRGRGAGADLHAAAARRGAESRDRAPGAGAPVLPPQALRPGAGGPLQDQPAAQGGRRQGPHGPHRGRLHRDHPLPDRAA